MRLVSPEYYLEEFLDQAPALLQFVANQTLVLEKMGFVGITATLKQFQSNYTPERRLVAVVVKATEAVPIITKEQMQKIYDQECVLHSRNCAYPKEYCNCGMTAHNNSIARAINKVASVIAGSGRAIAHDTLKAFDRSQ